MSANPIIKHFKFDHHPEKLQEIIRPIGELALAMDEKIKDSPEKTAGLRKLIEAKDCLVMAHWD